MVYAQGMTGISSDANNSASQGRVGYKNPPNSGSFQPGQSGNPAGRPAGPKNTKTIVELVLSERAMIPGLLDDKGRPEGVRQVSKHMAMVHAQVEKALKGDTGAFNAVFDRVDGKPTQAVEVGAIGEREAFEEKLRQGKSLQQIAAEAAAEGEEEAPAPLLDRVEDQPAAGEAEGGAIGG